MLLFWPVVNAGQCHYFIERLGNRQFVRLSLGGVVVKIGRMNATIQRVGHRVAVTGEVDGTGTGKTKRGVGQMSFGV